MFVLLAALLTGFALHKLKVPGGMMVGAAIGACALNLSIGGGLLPSGFRTLAQIIVGAFIGSGVSRNELRQMRQTVKPALVVILGMFLFNIAAGFVIHRVSSIDLLTAFLCATPGGVSDIPIIAAEMGADASKVLVLQFIRFAVGIGIFPTLIGKITQHEDQILYKEETALDHGKPSVLPVLLTLTAAAGFGLLGKVSGVPAGTMAFSTIGSIAFRQVYPKAGIPRVIRRTAQWLSGAYIGASIGIQQLRDLRLLPVPALILLLSLFLSTFVIAYTLRHFKCFHLRESLLAATPAGASDMALISADLGISNIKLILIHIMRVIAAVSLFPSLLKLIAGWLG